MPSQFRFAGLALLLFIFAAALNAQTNAPAKTPPKKGASDIELVERLLAARKEYQSTLESLRAQYISNGDIEHARWAEEELLQYHRIPKQAYRLELDVPPPTLKGEQNIPEANQLYIRAMTFKDKTSWGTDYIDNQRRAEILLQQILTNYPQSNKIDDTAYQLGDLYEGKAYRQYERAAAYFERCFQWDPKTHTDARLCAARLYERYLNERTKAIQIYTEITKTETDPKHIDEANRRLAELQTKK